MASIELMRYEAVCASTIPRSDSFVLSPGHKRLRERDCSLFAGGGGLLTRSVIKSSATLAFRCLGARVASCKIIARDTVSLNWHETNGILRRVISHSRKTLCILAICWPLILCIFYQASHYKLNRIILFR